MDVFTNRKIQQIDNQMFNNHETIIELPLKK
jgi:hypothetical protein